jgi:hypothetical protein
MMMKMIVIDDDDCYDDAVNVNYTVANYLLLQDLSIDSHLSIYHINLSYLTCILSMCMSILSISGTKGSSPGIMILYTTHVIWLI